MSGKIVNNVFRASGVIAATPGGLDWSTAVVTGSTLSATAGKGYYINTTSNACTVTLPSSATTGDQIVLVDYARTWSINNLIIDSNGLNFQGDPDTYTVDYSTAGQSLSIVYSDATKGWIPVSDDAVAEVPVAPPTQKAIFAFGNVSGGQSNISNLVSSSGVFASDTTGVGTSRDSVGAASYGLDKAIFAYGNDSVGGNNPVSMSNLVSNSGVVATDVSGVGTARNTMAACGYGGDKAIFGYGTSGSNVSLTNLVNNSGVIAADVTGVGTVRQGLAAAVYGGDKGIFAYGDNSGVVSLKNLVSNSGVVAADVTGVGTARRLLAACSYGGDKAIFGYGVTVSMTNLVSNIGVVSSDVTGVGTARYYVTAAGYGGDKGVFAYSHLRALIKNLVSNTGVVASDTSIAGTGRSATGAAGYSTSA